MNKLNVRSLKGMKDYLPNDMFLLNYVKKCFKNIILSYCFNEIKFPIIENSNLFRKCIDLDYNLFSKEMYSFLYYNKFNLCLRPEGTICCLRLYLQNKLFLNNFFNKFWYIGSMFRHEKPQKGRYREFIQIGLESYNNKSFLSDIELILIIKRLWKKLDIENFLILEINTIGTLEDREKYFNYIKKKFSFLIKKNINYLNFFNKNIIKYNNFPKLIDFINEKSLINFKNICNKLDFFGIKYVINNSLIRGIDYYNDFIFEWKNSLIKNNSNTICAGGRYDKLSNYISNFSIPAVGCAIGLDRLCISLKECYNKKYKNNNINIYILCSYNEDSRLIGLIISEEILNCNFNKVNIYNYNLYYNNLNNLISKIIKINIRILIIIDKKEIDKNYITIKDLYKNKQKKVIKEDVISVLIDFLNI